MLTISCLLIGQMSLIGLHKSLRLTQGMFTLFGCGYSLIFISTFDRIYRQIISKGYSDCIETYLVVSGTLLIKQNSQPFFFNYSQLSIQFIILLGIWYSAYYLGAFVGPTLGGVLINIHGFDSMTVAFAVIFGGSSGINLLEFIYKKYFIHKNHEYYKILHVQNAVLS